MHSIADRRIHGVLGTYTADRILLVKLLFVVKSFIPPATISLGYCCAMPCLNLKGGLKNAIVHNKSCYHEILVLITGSCSDQFDLELIDLYID